jgi:hypothetical protein
MSPARPRGSRSWNPRISAAWAHKDGKGFNLDLELIPMKTGRFVIRENRAEDGSEEKGQ